MDHHIHKNLSLRDALRIAKQLGCSVHLNKSGETVVAHPTWEKRLTIHTMRHSTTQILVSRLRRLQRQLHV